jgi:hypothetical protein
MLFDLLYVCGCAYMCVCLTNDQIHAVLMFELLTGTLPFSKQGRHPMEWAMTVLRVREGCSSGDPRDSIANNQVLLEVLLVPDRTK